MTRDMDLIREVLFAAERLCEGNDRDKLLLSVADLPEKYHSIESWIIKQHIWLVHSARGNSCFLDGDFDYKSATEPYCIGRLTEKGRDYLDKWRFFAGLEKRKDNPGVWRAIRKFLHSDDFSFGSFGKIFN